MAACITYLAALKEARAREGKLERGFWKKYLGNRGLLFLTREGDPDEPFAQMFRFHPVDDANKPIWTKGIVSSPIEDIGEENGDLVVLTRNSIYRFALEEEVARLIP